MLLCDFCMFSPLKKAQKGCRFGSDEDIRATVVQWFQQWQHRFLRGDPLADVSSGIPIALTMGTVFNSLCFFSQDSP
jgi:hypothetical protein